MWSKTFAAVFAGCFISVSIMLNFNYLLPIATDTKLFIGLLIAFPIWVIAMIYCYTAPTGFKAWKRCLIPLSVSVLVNIGFFAG